MNLELNEAERLTLQELSLHHRYVDFHRRALGVLALAKGHPLPVVADILGVTPQTADCLSLAQSLAHTRPDGPAGWPSRRRPGQAHGRPAGYR
jgi:hypothetical protein